MCGDHTSHVTAISGGWGPPPHAQGPTDRRHDPLRVIGDHPSRGGECRKWLGGSTPCGALHAWGPLPGSRGCRRRHETTPACAGTTCRRKTGAWAARDRLRTRGDHRTQYALTPAREGPTPHTRGSQGSGAGRPEQAFTSCSPHPWGWSRADLPRWVQPAVLPASAGMVPRSRRCSTPRASAPRTRGGWPRGRPLRRHLRAVLPAPAGVVRTQGSTRDAGSCVPRACRDGPITIQVYPADKERSRPPRGWSPPLQGGRRPAPVLPAPAGVVSTMAMLRSR